MNKEQFNNLEIIEQIEYINNQLEQKSLTAIAKEIGIGRNTIADRFKAKGYKLINKRYTATTEATETMENTKVTADTIDTKDIDNTDNTINLTKEQFESLTIDNKIDTINNLLKTYNVITLSSHLKIKLINYFRAFEYEYKQYNKYDKFEKLKDKSKDTNNTNDTKVLDNRIDGLEKQIKAIMGMIDTTNTTKELKRLSAKDIKRNEGTTVSRAYRINEDVHKEFKQLCRRFSIETDCTVTDIINTAIIDFMDKYK